MLKHAGTSRTLHREAEVDGSATPAGCSRGYQHKRSTASLLRSAILLIICSCVFLATLLACTNTASGSEVDQDKLVKLKAAYLYNLLKFTYWPEDKFEDKESPVKVIFVGDTLVAKIFVKAVEERTVQNRAIKTTLVSFPPEGYEDSDLSDEEKQALLDKLHQKLHASHVVFVSDELRKDWHRLRALTDDCQTLLVSDMNRFAEDGGMVSVSLDENNRLGFIVNQDELEERGLRLGSSLMKLAEVVKRSQSLLHEFGVKPCVLMLWHGGPGAYPETEGGMGS